MYVGKLVEYGRTPQIIGRPLHPYAKALAAAIPEADPDLTRSKAKLQLRSLDIPKLTALPSGCVFHPRCPYIVPGLCDEVAPVLVEVGDGREAACHVVANSVAPNPSPLTLTPLPPSPSALGEGEVDVESRGRKVTA